MDADILVLGGGLMGLATARAAAALDVAVTVVDPLPLVNEWNASNDESKVFRFAYGNDEASVHLAAEALQGWLELERESGLRLLRPTGVLLFDEPGGFGRDSLATLTRLGHPCEALSGPETLARFPAFAGFPGAVLDNSGGWLHPPSVLAALEASALSRGVSVRRGVAATRIDDDATGVTVALDDGSSLRARVVVVAAGAGAPGLVDVGVPITVTRQVEFFLAAPAGLRGFPVFAALEGGFYGFPVTDGVMKIADHRKGPVVTDWRAPRPDATAAEEATLRAWLERFMPAFADARVARSRVCLYDNSPDDAFVLGPAAGRPRVIVGAGFSGHGFKFGPAVGARLAAFAARAL